MEKTLANEMEMAAKAIEKGKAKAKIEKNELIQNMFLKTIILKKKYFNLFGWKIMSL